MLAVLFTLVLQSGASPPPAATPALIQQTQPTQANPSDQKAEQQHQKDIQLDIQEGAKEAAEVEKNEKLSTNKDYQARVARIGAEIAAAANSGPVNCLWGDKRFNKFNYVYKVLQGNDVNAFSVRGGHIYVYEGLMKEVQSDDELAGVLGHETAHAAFRHVTTMIHDEQSMLNYTLPLMLMSIFAAHNSENPGIGIQAAQLLMQAKGSGWSIHAEEAADYGGFQYLEKTHYNPTGMLTFMERLAEIEKGGLNVNWTIFQTHPIGRERAEAIVKYMKEAGVPIQRSRVSSYYRATFQPAEKGLIEIDFNKRPLAALAGPDATARATSAVSALNAFFDSMPEMYEIEAGPGGNVMGHGRVLLSLNAADAAAASTTLGDLRQKTIENMRMTLFNMAYRIWSSHM